MSIFLLSKILGTYLIFLASKCLSKTMASHIHTHSERTSVASYSLVEIFYSVSKQGFKKALSPKRAVRLCLDLSMHDKTDIYVS
jgi:hypothetical protein